MGWIGNIVGGVSGLGIGGPLGMIAGVAFGNLFDKANQMAPGEGATSAGADSRTYTHEQQSQLVFFVGAFSMLAKIATVDGRLLPEEQRKVEEFIQKDLKLDSSSRNAALKVFNAALTGGGTFDQFATQFYQNFAHERPLLELMVDILIRVAAADGKIDSAEERMITSAANLFRISDSLLKSMLQRHSGGTISQHADAVLGLTPNASVEEIKKAYRKLSIDFHPDSVASKGLPEEFTTFATDKFRQIQDAYDTIKKERNFA